MNKIIKNAGRRATNCRPREDNVRSWPCADHHRCEGSRRRGFAAAGVIERTSLMKRVITAMLLSVGAWLPAAPALAGFEGVGTLQPGEALFLEDSATAEIYTLSLHD